jgi:hypothetical protein
MISLALEIARRKRLGHVFLGLDPSGRAVFTARIPVMRVPHRPSVLEILRDQRGAVGTYYSSTSDGSVRCVDAHYAHARDGTGTLSLNPGGSTAIVVGQTLASSNYYLDRGFMYFDTSAIGASSTVTDVSANFTLTADASATDFDITIVSSTAADPLTTGDWGNVGSTSFGAVTTVGIAVNSNTSVTLNASGIAAINKAGITEFAFRSSLEIANTAPTGWDRVFIASADHGTPSYFPYLSVTYTSGDKSVADTCTFTDAIGGIEARVTVADTMTATDAIGAITAYVTVADGLTATDGLQITVNVTVADAVTATDVVAYLEKLYPHLVNLQSGTYTVVLQSGKFIVNLQSGTRTVT